MPACSGFPGHTAPGSPLQRDDHASDFPLRPPCRPVPRPGHRPAGVRRCARRTGALHRRPEGPGGALRAAGVRRQWPQQGKEQRHRGRLGAAPVPLGVPRAVRAADRGRWPEGVDLRAGPGAGLGQAAGRGGAQQPAGGAVRPGPAGTPVRCQRGGDRERRPAVADPDPEGRHRSQLPDGTPGLWPAGPDADAGDGPGRAEDRDPFRHLEAQSVLRRRHLQVQPGQGRGRGRPVPRPDRGGPGRPPRGAAHTATAPRALSWAP